MTPEGIVKNKVKKVLKDFGAYYEMHVPYGYGSASLDFVCCYKGWFIAIETKAPGKKPTKRQAVTIKQILDADGIAIVIDGTNINRLIDLLKTIQSNSDNSKSQT